MYTSNLLFAGLSVLTLLDGVKAQQGQGRGKGGNAGAGAATAVASSSSVAAAAGAASATTSLSGAAAVQAGINAAIASASTAVEAPPPAASLALAATNIQADSNSNGGPTNGQAASLTDDANFINFCSGKLLTNGLQFSQGSCNGIPMGDIPPVANTVSTVIQQPTNGENLQPNQPFNVVLQVNNLDAGTFTNPDNTYYAAPQHLNAQKQIIGHVHVTIQDMNANGGADGKVPPDGSKFAFFKGIDDDGNGAGQLTAVVTSGLPAGAVYRICTLVAAANHQPVIMPLAQRGTQDDCIRISVGQNGQAAAAAGNGAGAGAAASSVAASAASASQPAAANAKSATGAAVSSSAAAAAAVSSPAAAAASNGNTGKTGNKGNSGGNGNANANANANAVASGNGADVSTSVGVTVTAGGAESTSVGVTVTAGGAGSQGTAPAFVPGRQDQFGGQGGFGGRGGRPRVLKRVNRIGAEPRRRFAARELIV